MIFKTPNDRFFSREAEILGVGRRPTIKTWQKPETALEKSLAPMVNDRQSDIVFNNFDKSKNHSQTKLSYVDLE